MTAAPRTLFLLLATSLNVAQANPLLDKLADNSWVYLNSQPSPRYTAFFRDPEKTEAQTPESRATTSEPAHREYTHPVYGDGKIFYFGGGHSGYAGNDVEMFDIERNVWTQSYKPNAPPADDSTYFSGGSERCFLDAGTGEARPYTLHGYGRTSYDSERKRYVCTAMFCATKLNAAANKWECAHKQFSLIAFDPVADKWSLLAIRNAPTGLVNWPAPDHANLSQWDANLGGLLAFHERSVWLYKNGDVTSRKSVSLDLGSAGADGAASLYIPELRSHLIAVMPQGGKPSPHLVLYNSVGETAQPVTSLPDDIQSRLGENGNFMMAYDTRHKKALVMQADNGPMRVWVYDVVRDAGKFDPANWQRQPATDSAPRFPPPDGASNRAPLQYDPTHNIFILLLRNTKPGGVETWAYRYK